MQWEYLSLKVHGNDQVYRENGKTCESHDFHAHLAQLGKDGWELVAALQEQACGPYLYHFKRPLVMGPPEIVMQIDGKAFARAVTPSIAHEYQTVLLKSTERGL